MLRLLAFVTAAGVGQQKPRRQFRRRVGDALSHMCASSGRCGPPAPPSSPFHLSSGIEMAMRSGSVYTIRDLTEHFVALLLLEMLSPIARPLVE